MKYLLTLVLAAGLLTGCATLDGSQPINIAQEIAHGIASEVLIQKLIDEGYTLEEATELVDAAHDAIHGDL